jgi:glycosyltransferase involved in cell wall biosynthesis
MRMQYKIVQVSKNYPPDIGGMERQAYLLAQELVSRGMPVEVITAEPRRPDNSGTSIIKAAPLVRNNTSKTSIALFGMHVFHNLLSKVLKREKFIVHGFGGFGVDKIILYFFKQTLGLKYVIKIGGSFTTSALKQLYSLPLQRRIPVKTIWHADALIVLDALSQKNLIRIGIDPEKIHIIKNGVPLPPLEQDTSLRIRERLESSTAALLYVGRVVEEKGISTLVEAFQQLSERHPRIRLWIVGDGDGLKRLKHSVEEKRLKNVTFWGTLKQSELKQVYTSADMFILPSYREGISNALLEAMSYQLPIIATRVGAVTSVVTDHREGILIPPRNPAAIVKGVQTLLDSPELAVSMGENARAKVSQEFSMEKTCSSHIRLFDRVYRSS